MFDPNAFIDADALAAVSVSEDDTGSEPEDAYATAAVSRRRVKNKFDILQREINDLQQTVATVAKGDLSEARELALSRIGQGGASPLQRGLREEMRSIQMSGLSQPDLQLPTYRCIQAVGVTP